MNLPSAGPERSPRKVAFALVDDELTFLTDNIDIRRMAGASVDSLAGSSVTEIFPELIGHEDRIHQLVSDPSDYLVLHGLHRRSSPNLDLYFDLQITSAPHFGKDLLLTVVDVTREMLLSHRLQEIKSVPPLKTTAEEIRQNLYALERWNNALFLLNQAGQLMTATLESQQVLEQVLQVAIELIGAEGSSVWLWDETEHDSLTCRAAVYKGFTPPILGQRLREGQGVAGWVAQTGVSTAVNNAEDDPRFYPGIDEHSGFKTVSLLVVPLRMRDEIIGVLEVVNQIERDFDADDLAIAETLAASASIAMDNARLVEALQEQTEDLRSRNEELDAFAHTVAHDLQNPLAQIIGFAAMLGSPDEELTAEDRETARQVIADNAQKMSVIIRELLLLSSVRQAEVEVRPLDMQKIVEAALARLTHMIAEYQADLILPDEWPEAMGYAPWIEEIWENYLSNALKYGGRPPSVEMGGTAQSGGMVRFWVKDNGPGLSPEDQSKLFAPFTKLTENGHGLGLSIVRRVVRKLGGQVAVESRLGSGSIFSFTLPTAKQRVDK